MVESKVKTAVQEIDHYELQQVLEDGNNGDTWKARDTKTNNLVCVKVFKNEDEATVKSWTDEMDIVQKKFDNPNVLKMLKGGRH